MSKVDWLRQIEERLAKATPGTWYVDESPQFRDEVPHPDGVFVDELNEDGVCTYSVIDESSTHAPDDMRFIAAAKSDILRLLSVINRVFKLIEQAPHANNCAHEVLGHLSQDEHGNQTIEVKETRDPCDCWKSQALTAINQEGK